MAFKDLGTGAALSAVALVSVKTGECLPSRADLNRNALGNFFSEEALARQEFVFRLRHAAARKDSQTVTTAHPTHHLILTFAVTSPKVQIERWPRSQTANVSLRTSSITRRLISRWLSRCRREGPAVSTYVVIVLSHQRHE